MKKNYKIPITWESCEIFEVEAENLQDAVNQAVSEFLQIPDEYYLDDSFTIDDENLFEYEPEKFDIRIAIDKFYED